MSKKSETKSENKSEKKNEKKSENKSEFKKHELVEHRLPQEISIFNADLEVLVYEKMFILFERLQLKQNLLKKAENMYDDKKAELLLTLDFKKITGESRPTIAMKEAVIKDDLEEFQTNVDKYNNDVDYYKNKLTIINDLIKNKRLLLRFEGNLLE